MLNATGKIGEGILKWKYFWKYSSIDLIHRCLYNFFCFKCNWPFQNGLMHFLFISMAYFSLYDLLGLNSSNSFQLGELSFAPTKFWARAANITGENQSFFILLVFDSTKPMISVSLLIPIEFKCFFFYKYTIFLFVFCLINNPFQIKPFTFFKKILSLNKI